MSGKRQTGTPAVRYLEAEVQAAEFLEDIAHTNELAVDTEGASFHRFVDRVYLLQLSTRDRHAILDPLAVSPPATLGALVADEHVEIVFHDADYDLRLLRQDYGWSARRVFDTRIAAQLVGIRQFGLAALLDRFFEVRLDKKHQRADWSMRPLTPEMLAYASQDTMHLLPLRDVLRDTLEQKGRLHWAEEEFARLQDVEWAADDPGNAFLRVRNARDLTRRELAILRELVGWRDAAAAALDRATFRVLSNETMLEIARLAPATPDDLMRIKGLPRGWSSGRVREVLEAVKRGVDVPEADLPRFPRAQRFDRDPHFDARVSALRGVRDHVAQQMDLDPGVLFSRERLEAVARRVPRSVEELQAVAGVRRWQAEAVGERLIKAI